MRLSMMLLSAALPLLAQKTEPLYRVNVVGSSTIAINYGDRNLPVRIGFEGTVLLKDARGSATIQSRKGAATIDAKFEGLAEPARYGPQYLTYVLWALTPNGRAVNLGQLVSGPSEKAKIRASTELQTFALIVTAEPYHAVTEPGGVVVLENVMLPETRGAVETVKIDSRLLRRGEVTFHTATAPQPPGRKVSMPEYEALLEIYQAENALNLAAAAGAREAAPAIYAGAEAQLRTAQAHQRAKAWKQVVPAARAATQAAEDARLATMRARVEAPTTAETP